MDRRSFIRRAAVGLGALVVAPAVFVRERAATRYFKVIHNGPPRGYDQFGQPIGARTAAIEVMERNVPMSAKQREQFMETLTENYRYYRDNALINGEWKS